ncbi:MAG: endonuclease/exonuclease/phosphatase family protein [Phycisphaerales bacterium]|nr:endonuclease/exonuclease/phosphatase family protein [Phycisphaerales bacterium]
MSQPDQTPGPPPRPPTRTPRRRRLRLAANLLLAVVCGAWLCPGLGWIPDLLANLGPQCALAALLLGLYRVARKRWAPAAVAAACALLGLLGPALQSRAARAAAPGNVRILFVNAAASNPRAGALLQSIRAANADVVVVVETPSDLLGPLRDDQELRAQLPYAWLPEAAGVGYTAVLSRWPQHGGDALSGGASQTLAAGVRAMRVDRPGAPFALLVLHPRSPRSPARWREGNALVEHALQVVDDRLAPSGLPLVAAGDLNSAPAGWRSRHLAARAGLRRAKPLWTPAGTWPSWSRWPMRVAIDDLLVAPTIGVVSWRALPAPGSDHSAVLVELAIPTP